MTEPPQDVDVFLYTDGACSGNPGPGGWAFLLRHPATGKEQDGSGAEWKTTNNRMELMAVIEGLSALKPGKRWRVHVVTDSEYVVKGITEWIKGWIRNNWRRGSKVGGPPVKNAELWQRLYEITRQHETTFEHVRGHAGHPENEACDRLAVAAIQRLRQQSD